MSSLGNEIDGDVITMKPKKSPWVIVGTLATAGVLVVGLVAFKQGNAALSQQMMRARIVAQGATVAIMLGASASAIASFKSSPQQ